MFLVRIFTKIVQLKNIKKFDDKSTRILKFKLFVESVSPVESASISTVLKSNEGSTPLFVINLNGF